MEVREFACGIVIAVVVTGVSTSAHHAFSAEFDAAQPVELRGKVTKVEWVNPHTWIHIDVQETNGDLIAWEIEAGAPNALIRRGWRKDSLTPGTELLVFGYRAKDGSNRANGRDITLPDGKVLFAGSSGTGAPYDDPQE